MTARRTLLQCFLLLLLLNLLLYVPVNLLRYVAQFHLYLCFELVLAVSLMLLTTRWVPRARKLAVGVASFVYCFLCLYELYRGLVFLALARPPVFVNDVLLAESGLAYLRSMWGGFYPVAWVVAVMAVVGLWCFAWKVNSLLCSWSARPMSGRVLIAGVVCLNCFCLGSLWWVGEAHSKAFVQVHGRRLLYNWRLSKGTEQALARFTKDVEASTQPALYREPLRQRPDVYIFEIESYGMALFDKARLQSATTRLGERVEAALGAQELTLVSRRLTAPVFGGGSWMSTASLMTGRAIRSSAVFLAFTRLAETQTNLARYFSQNGYYTLTVQAGTDRGDDLYGFEDFVTREALGYQGPRVGWGVVPDQWSLDVAFSRYLEKETRPRLLQFMSVTTHYPWQRPPRIMQDPQALQTQASFFPEKDLFATQVVDAMGADGPGRDYMTTIAYDWELLLATFRKRVRPNFIAVILGDHQPSWGIAGRADGYDVALHLVTDRPELLNGIEQVGFEAGFAPPAAIETLGTEGVFSLLLGILNRPSPDDPITYEPRGMGTQAVEVSHRPVSRYHIAP